MNTKRAVQAAHVGRAVRHCRCAQCVAHRFLNLQAAADAKTAALFEELFRYAPLARVGFGANATAELRARLNGGSGR